MEIIFFFREEAIVKNCLRGKAQDLMRKLN
jgi:hypothetical protein